jgi:hypothetical protein
MTIETKVRSEPRFILPNKEGEFKKIHKNELAVDVESYQRLNIERAKQIVKEGWRWPDAGALNVSVRLDGSYWVFDGGARHTAAMEIPEIEYLPCMVYESGDKAIAEEAGTFVRLGTKRVRVSGFDKHRANVKAGNPVSMFVNKLLMEAEANKVKAKRQVDQLTTEASFPRRKEALQILWPIIIEIFGEKTLIGSVWRGLLYLEWHLISTQSLGKRKWRKRLVAVGPHGLEIAAKRSAFKNSAPYWARGIMEELNRGQRERLAMVKE